MSDIALVKFNSKFIPPPFGFRNIGATCYFNSLIQSLLTCTSLTELFIKNRNNKEFAGNSVAVVYLSIIDCYYKNDSYDLVSLHNKSPELWNAMILYLKSNNTQIHFGRGQEDTYEAFIMLMQCWEKIKLIRDLFSHTYHGNYLCFECKKLRFSYDKMINTDYDKIVSDKFKKSNEVFEGISTYVQEETDNIWLIYDTHFIINHDYTTEQEEKIQKYCKNEKNLYNNIMCPKSIHEGLICKHCGIKGDKLQFHTLAVIPEILLIVIKKYIFKRSDRNGIKLNINTDLPPILTIEAKDDGQKLMYRPIAKIMHSGGMSGGHYWTHTIRNNEGNLGWYNMNDSNFSKVDDLISDDTNTYTVIYHLFPSL